MVKLLIDKIMKRLLFILIISTIQSFAQTNSFLHYGVESGLIQSQVQTIVQDRDGYLWIGTLAGVSKYDGISFTNYTKRDGLAEDWITACYEDSKGNIWFGHWGGGVSKYNYKAKNIEGIYIEDFNQINTISAILEDKKGNFWFGTKGSGAYKYDVDANKIYIISAENGLSSASVSSICEDNFGNIWIGTDRGITVYDPKYEIDEAKQDAHAYVYITSQDGLASNNISCIIKTDNDEIWIGTQNTGITIIKQENKNELSNLGQIKNLTTDDGLSSNHIKTIYEDHSHNIWIGTPDGGVSQFIPQKQSESVGKGIFKTFSTRQGLNFYHVNSILQDREGIFWIGTEIGLNKYRGEIFQTYDQSDNLINNIVWSVMEDSRGNIWFGTNEGLSKFTFSEVIKNNILVKRHKVKNYTTEDGLSSNIILSLFEDKEGAIWIGTLEEGVCKLTYDANMEGFPKARSRDLAFGKPSIETFNIDDGLIGTTVYSITDDKQGNIWVGTKDGVSKYNIQTATFTNYTTKNGLGGNHIYRIFKDHKGNLWMGALGGYLTMYDGEKFKTFDESNGIKDKFILSITEDKAHNLWFGAYGGGLYKYDEGLFTNYSTKDGLSSESPYLLIADDNNNIWIGTNQGIDKFEQKTNRFLHYGKSEGFFGIETNPNAVCLTKNGNIWFGTIMGAVKFNPKEDKPNAVEPTTLITGLKVFFKDFDFPKDGIFKHDEDHISFHFIGVSLTNANSVQYQFKLEGHDNEWSPFTSERSMTYANLPSGEYEFKLKAANNSGLWNKAPTTYRFTILTPWWETRLFYAGCILVVLGIFFLIIRLRTRNLKRAKIELENQVQLRTQELAAKNKDILDSIEYAKRIQQAILPIEEEIHKNLEDAFILYKPKDIVSGDFYWFGANGTKVIAAIDCTGHGVPGAFMSMIGYNLLNELINENHITQPDQILNQLHQKVRVALKQTDETSQSQDGMDIAICAIDLQKCEVQFSGAFRPLYHFSKGELNEIKGDKFPIGGHQRQGEQHFTNHTIKVQKGDTIYIFSDGYVDQFGGPRGKKFMNKQLKELLSGIQDKSMAEQHQLLQAKLEEWQGDLEQVDDILVMGMRF